MAIRQAPSEPLLLSLGRVWAGRSGEALLQSRKSCKGYYCGLLPESCSLVSLECGHMLQGWACQWRPVSRALLASSTWVRSPAVSNKTPPKSVHV